MLPLFIVLSSLVALLVTLVVIPAIRDYAVGHGMVDSPDNVRKLHKTSVPRLGGIGIAVGSLAGYLALVSLTSSAGMDVGLPTLNPAFWLGAVLIVLVGLYDDVNGLGFKKKLLFQIVAAYLLVFDGFVIRVSDIPIPFLQSLTPGQAALIYLPLTLLWIVGIMNAVNLIDGLDGLAGGIVLIAMVSMAAVFGLTGHPGLILLAIPLIGALIGFLRYNINPASIFMGDSGSLFLGYMLAAYTLSAPVNSNPLIGLLVPVVVLSLPLGDAALSIFRRVSEGKAICSPDHDHVHHRMSRHYPVPVAVMRLYTVAIFLGAMGVAMAIVPKLWAVVIATGVLVSGVIFLRNLGYFRSTIRRRHVTRIATRPAISINRASKPIKEEQLSSGVPA